MILFNCKSTFLLIIKKKKVDILCGASASQITNQNTIKLLNKLRSKVPNHNELGDRKIYYNY
jgi:hypothetical protein